jgi:hypothetical protein
MKTIRIKPIGLLLFIMLFQVSLFSFGQLNVVPFKSGNLSPEKDGVIYSLPRNVIKVQLEIVKTESFRGPYAAYAAKLLGLTRVIEENAIGYEIGKIELSSFSESDPDQIYFVEFDGRSKNAGSFMLTLSDEGFIGGYTDISSVNKEVRNAMASGDFSNENLKPFRDLLKPVLIEKVDTIIRRISVDTATFEEKVLKKSIFEKMPEQQAREIADLIYKIQDSKFNLITGDQEVNYSRESFEFMLEQLNKQEKEYLALFKGTNKKTQQVYTWYITPPSSREGTLETICRFSKAGGVSDKSTSVGESVSLVISPMNRNKTIEDFIKQRNQAVKKVHGFYYRIPEKSEVTLRVGGNAVAEGQMLISQMGVVTFLPTANIKDIRFHPESGAIKQVISE